jgi:glycosyltransferase involved in cell wall biosynthesis
MSVTHATRVVDGPRARIRVADRRLVLLCEHFYPEMVSTGMHMTELATRLAAMGWEITVYTAKPSWGTHGDDTGKRIPHEMVHEGVRIVRVPTVGSQKGGLLSKAVAALTFVSSVSGTLLASRADYRAMVVTTNPPFVGMLAWFVSRLYQRPYLLIVYDVFPDFAVSLGVLPKRSLVATVWERVTRTILSGAAVTVVIGRDMRELIEGKMPPRLRGRIVTIPNWSDERRVRPVPPEENGFRQEHVPEGAFVVQYAGRLGEKHTLEPLIVAARALRDTEVVFQFVGDGAKKPKLEALAASDRLDNVQFLPYQPMERLSEMLSTADLAVVCLEQGHTGISVPSKAYGVIASGTPVVGILDPQGEIGMMIAETGCGVLVQPDGEEIADVIRRLMADPERRRAMGEAGRRAFLDGYTLARAAERYDAALTSMVRRDRIARLGAGAPPLRLTATSRPFRSALP